MSQFCIAVVSLCMSYRNTGLCVLKCDATLHIVVLRLSVSEICHEVVSVICTAGHKCIQHLNWHVTIEMAMFYRFVSREDDGA
jgi:hypothetical protein